MLNIFKINKALKQAKKHVEEVNHLNDDLIRIGKEQSQIIIDQLERIELLQTQSKSSAINIAEKVFNIEFEHFVGITATHENAYTTKEQAVQYLLDAGYRQDQDETYLNEEEEAYANVSEKQIVKKDKTKE